MDGAVKQAQALAASEAAIAGKAADVEQRTKALADQRKLLAEARSATAADNEQLAELARERDCARYRLAVAKAEKCKTDLATIAKHLDAAKALAEQAKAKESRSESPAGACPKRNSSGCGSWTQTIALHGEA